MIGHQVLKKNVVVTDTTDFFLEYFHSVMKAFDEINNPNKESCPRIAKLIVTKICV